MLLKASENSPMKATRWLKSPAATRCVCQVRWRRAACSALSAPAMLPLAASGALEVALGDGERELVERRQLIEQDLQLGVVLETRWHGLAAPGMDRPPKCLQGGREVGPVGARAHAGAISAVKRQVRSPVHQQSTSLTTKG